MRCTLLQDFRPCKNWFLYSRNVQHVDSRFHFREERAVKDVGVSLRPGYKSIPAVDGWAVRASLASVLFRQRVTKAEMLLGSLFGQRRTTSSFLSVRRVRFVLRNSGCNGIWQMNRCRLGLLHGELRFSVLIFSPVFPRRGSDNPG